MQEILSALGIGAFEYLPQSNQLSWSLLPPCLHARSLPDTEYACADLLETVHPDERHRLSDALQGLSKDNTSLTIDLPLNPAIAHDVMLRLTMQFGGPDDTGPARIVGLSQDVTDELNSQRLLDSRQRELQFQQAVLRSQFENSRDGIVVVSENRQLISYNSRYVQIWNLPPSALTSPRVEDVRPYILPQILSPEVVVQRLDALYADPLRTEDFEVQLLDGRIIEFHTAPLVGEQRTILGRMWYLRDITERRQNEERTRNQQLQSRLMQGVLAAQEQEQRRISRDLHDVVGQSLTAVGLGLEAIRLAPSGEDQARLIDEVQHMIAASVCDVRRLARDMRPTLLDDLGLEAAIRRLLQDCRSGNGLICKLDWRLTQPERLDNYLETALFRIVQASLNNVVKHARAKIVQVTLLNSTDSLFLTIHDNGCGFAWQGNDKHHANAGLGLLGMRERAELLGGTFSIDSEVGQGTSIAVCIPLV